MINLPRTLVFLLLAGSAAHAATFTLTSTIGDIGGLTAGVSRAIMVVDSAGDGFAGINDVNTDNSTHLDLASFGLTAGSTVGDDMVFWTTTAQDFGGGLVGFDFGTQAFDTSNAQWSGLLATGKRIGVYWFPDGGNASGSAFGFYRTDSAEQGNLGYFTPADGASNTILTLTPNLGGDVSSTAINANNGTIGAVPEPSKMVLAGFGLLGILARRRRA